MEHTLKQMCNNILAIYPETRSDDRLLVRILWKNYFPGYIHKSIMGHEIIRLEDIDKLPTSDSIIRYRRAMSPLFPATQEVNARRHRYQKEKKEEFAKSLEQQLIDIL